MGEYVSFKKDRNTPKTQIIFHGTVIAALPSASIGHRGESTGYVRLRMNLHCKHCI
jgi:hypothetical protein